MVMTHRDAQKQAAPSAKSVEQAVQKKSALRGASYEEQVQMLAPDGDAKGGQAKGEQGKGGGFLSKVGGALGAIGSAIKNPKDTLYGAVLGAEGRQEEVLGDGHDIPNQDIILEQLAHQGAYGKLDTRKLADWGYREAGACNDPESGFRAVLYMPTDDALKGESKQSKVIQATHGGKPPPVLAFRGTAEKRGWQDDTNRQGIGTYQFSSNETRVAGMLGAAGGKAIVTGHSLGGALAQLAATHFPSQVLRVCTFQSPGINQDEADKLKQHNAKAAPGDQVKSTHHRADGDIVHKAGDALTEGDVYTHHSVGVSNPMDHSAFPLARLAAARGDMIGGVNDAQMGDKGGDKLVNIGKQSTDEAKGGIGTRIAEGGRKVFGGVMRDESMEVYAAFWQQIKEMVTTKAFGPKQILQTIADTDKLTPVQKIKMRDQATALIGKWTARPSGTPGRGQPQGPRAAIGQQRR